MMQIRRAASIAAVLLVVGLGGGIGAQGPGKPTNDLPNPYQTVADYFKLPPGRTWGSTSAVEIDKDGRSIWVAERCGVNSCADPATGKTKDFSRISGLYITKDDTLYAADSESSVTSHPGNWKRGIRIGSAKDRTVQYLIPDPDNPDAAKTTSGTSAAEGVAVDAQGNVYGAEVGPKAVKKYVKRSGTQ